MNLLTNSIESNYGFNIKFWQALIMKNINDRFRNLVMQVTSDSRRYKELEELTEISGSTWKTFWTRGGFPSAQMLEAINMKFPQYAFWLATGITDVEYGHLSPNSLNPTEVLDLSAFTSKEDAVKGLALGKLLKDASQNVFLIQLKMDELSNRYKYQQLIDLDTYQSELHTLLIQLEMAQEVRNQHQISYAKLKDNIEKKLSKSPDEYHRYLMWTVNRAKAFVSSAEDAELNKTTEEFNNRKKSPSTDIPF